MRPDKLHLKECDEMVLNKKQIYIVDDDESVRRALGILLATYGFRVDTFTCAEEFFSSVPDSAAGCLILDIHMPGLDGWKAQKRIIESGFKRPVIIISADKNSLNYERALKAGAVGYLQKPFNDQALVDLIKVGLEKQKRIPPLIVWDDKN